ncbi:peptide methionine sulfoxide reductase msrA/msrB [Filimonas lacunae]|uniref:Peptide methionine sulfoxide reductase MsrA n=1 Tax=Filimonas lacunae TaxID=477680 RepID=A0A173MMH7_9BACT|nr:bifunctional methionine sulfoxide reductase B/A protein [Filimonas lacunae]BAV08853.1 peptide methionine sulfoxide reductase MsrB [Filimonas lacunae]SIS62805.1 peptide methionine sulfoxide reductase msrA/msrB [Filimonas lacunae]
MIQQTGWPTRMLAVMLLITQVITGCAQTTANNLNNKETSMKTDNNTTIHKTEQEWKEQLTPEQYYILRQKGTERPFTGKLLMNKEKGVYKCAACGNELFTDDMKFDSHCGWPSFDKEIAGGKIIQKEDNTLGMHRVEILCAKCGGHLGHIFDDGPTETGQRYCVNSVSLEFAPAGAPVATDSSNNAAGTTSNIDTITLGGGCFWCVEAVYEQLDGVIKVESGYSGGPTPNPTYKAVCTGTTGHAEVVQITYDKTKTSVDEILKVFFTVHDPTTLNRQGADVGTQYRSVIYYRNAEQEQKAREIITALNQEHVYDSPVVTEVTAFDKFYKAEDYHQNYYEQNPEQGYCRMVVRPKVEKFEKLFKNRLKKVNQ